MDIAQIIESLPPDRVAKLSEAIDKRFGSGYFGLNAGIYFEVPTESSGYKHWIGKCDYIVTFSNFNSTSGWATVGALRFDVKKDKYVINFNGPGLGRTGRYS